MADQFFENFKATVEESVFPGDEKKVD